MDETLAAYMQGIGLVILQYYRSSAMSIKPPALLQLQMQAFLLKLYVYAL